MRVLLELRLPWKVTPSYVKGSHDSSREARLRRLKGLAGAHMRARRLRRVGREISRKSGVPFLTPKTAKYAFRRWGLPDAIPIRSKDLPVSRDTVKGYRDEMGRLVAIGSVPHVPRWASRKAARLYKKFSRKESKNRVVQPHPHAYPWHDGHTHFHEREEGHPHVYRNNQFAKPGSSSVYADIASHWGEVRPGTTPNLKHYPLKPKHTKHIHDMLRGHGYKYYYAGGKYGKPDLKNRNYNTGHLMIYDPGSEASFSHKRYTDQWRKVHELAHALTYKKINSKYGEGRRLGKLGVRTPHEMKRSVEWEWHAAHKQRELHAKHGVHISDKDFHRELNTVMHDAVHRAITGKFTDPSAEGFHPSSKKVPLSKALKMIDHHAKRLGLRHDHDSFLSRRSRSDR